MIIAIYKLRTNVVIASAMARSNLGDTGLLRIYPRKDALESIIVPQHPTTLEIRAVHRLESGVMHYLVGQQDECS